MKVFYSATYQGEQEFGKFYSDIYKEIEQLGYENVDDDVIDLTYDKYIAEMSNCLLYTSPSPRDRTRSRMPSSP